MGFGYLEWACHRGGWAEKRGCSREDRLGVGEFTESAALRFPGTTRVPWQLSSRAHRETQGSDEEPHTAWPLPEDNHLGGRAANPESLEGEMEQREHPRLHFSTSLIDWVASSSTCLYLCPGAFPVAWES